MRPTRKFQPPAPAALEDRISPSSGVAGGAHPAAAHKAAPTHVRAQSTSATFPLNIADSIAAGFPVDEQRTTKLGLGAVQTEVRSINPNPNNGTTDTYSTITLANNGGIEHVSDFSFDNGSGVTTEVISTTLPDGSAKTETVTKTVSGDTTQLKGTISITGLGQVESYTGQTVVRGAVTTTDKTITESSGTGKQHTVTTQRGELRVTDTSTLTPPSGPRQVTHSTTTIVRLQPSSPVALGNLNGPAKTA